MGRVIAGPRLGWSGWIVCFLLACGEGAPESGPEASEARLGTTEPWFELRDGAEIGLDFEYWSGASERFFYPESMGGGVGLCDLDGDGDLDVYFAQGGRLDAGNPSRPLDAANELFWNRGGGRFERAAPGAGVEHQGYAMGIACGDIDGDGDQDVYVTNLGPDVLLRNRGDGTFEDVTREAGLGDPSWGASATFLDYDRDGHLDLFVTNYLYWSPAVERECHAPTGARDYCGPSHYRAPARDSLYRNLGDGKFVEVTESSGLGAAVGTGLGTLAIDFDGDGRLDLYVANDQMPNQLWIQDEESRFSDQGLLAGVAVSGSGSNEAGMGVAVGDLSGEGWPSIVVTHLTGETNTLYVNQDGFFEDRTAWLGLAAPSEPYTGFGVGWQDFDQDGHLDLFVANGRVKLEASVFDPDQPFAEPDQLFAGSSLGSFSRVPLSTPGTERPTTSRGAAFGDLDQDGDLDGVVVRRDAPVAVALNRAPDRPGFENRQLAVSLQGTTAGSAIGSRVSVAADGNRMTRWVQPGYSYLSANDPRAHFGVGGLESVDRVEVQWADGRRTALSGPLLTGVTYVLRPRP